MYRTRLVRQVSIYSATYICPLCLTTYEFHRCTWSWRDPDKPSRRRCREHTEALVEALELGLLWDEYGLVGDVMVNLFSFKFFHSSLSDK